MTNNTQQLNLTYQQVQDRLLLRASSAEGEFRIWLTRRYSQLLLNVILDLIEREGGLSNISSDPETIKQFKNGAFGQEYATKTEHLSANGKQAFPLGEAGVLGFQIQYERLPSGLYNLRLLPESGLGLNLALSRNMLYLVFTLLEQALGHADWKIHLPSHHKDPVH